MLNFGLVINPLAGIGGAVAMKGSDGSLVVDEALRRGAIPRAQERCKTALNELLPWREQLHFFTASNEMGENVLRELGFAHTVVFHAAEKTTALDTESAMAALAQLSLGLILFAGGDGTARNVCSVLDEDTPVLGIPAGVKIHSAVYAVSPAAAGKVVADILQGHAVELLSANVMDLDEDAYRAGNVRAKLFGYMRVPAHPLLQQSKVSMRSAEPTVVDEIAEFVAGEMQNECLYILGSGSTCAAIKQQLAMDGTLLGIDAWFNGQQLLTDATEQQLFALLQQHQNTKLIVTVIGGQGHVFGRGNQQLSARVLRHIGRANIAIVASPGKLQSLQGRALLIDSGDSELDREFAGPIRVITGYQAEAIYPLS